MAEQSQNLENLAIVVSQALGGSNDDGDDDDVEVIESWDQLVSAFRTVGGSLG